MKNKPNHPRLIAQKIARSFILCGITSSMLATSLGIVASVYETSATASRDLRIEEINEEKYGFLKEFKLTKVFKQEYSSAINEIKEKYLLNLISLEQLENSLNYINSFDFVEDIVKNSNNTQLKSELEIYVQRVNDTADVYNEEIAGYTKIFNGSMAVAGLMFACGFIPGVIADVMLTKDERDKASIAQSKG